MTQTFATNEVNDLYVGGDGNLVLLSGIEAVLAACKTASLAQLGEMVLATGAGLPNFQAVFNGTPNLPLYETYLRATLLAVPGVVSVAPIEMSVENHILTYTALITTEFGTAVLNG